MSFIINNRLVAALLCCLTLPAFSIAQETAVDAEGQAEFSIPDNEKPFWESAQKFLDAYAERDAQAIGELFSKDAEFLDELGVRSEGREAIVNRFEEAFIGSEDAMIESITIDKVKHLGDSVALEEGTVVSSANPEAPRSVTRYAAIHRKNQDGVWLIEVLKDFPREELGREEQLAQLNWLIGEWVNEDSGSRVYTSCRWSDDENYLLREFKVQTNDGRELTGTQRTGWDPIHKKLRTWTFDSAGGFFTGYWTKTGNGWLLTSAGVSAEGESVSSTAIYKLIDGEMFTWEYQNLILGEEVRTQSEPVTMVRKPPEPQLQTSQTE